MYQRKQIATLLSLCIIFFGTLFALPQKALSPSQGRTFDPNNIYTLRGEVARVDSLRPMMQLLLDTDREEIVVHVGPSWFMLKEDFNILPGDDIAVKGSRVTLEGEPTLIAMEIKKNGRILKLRDDKGYPLWGSQDLME